MSVGTVIDFEMRRSTEAEGLVAPPAHPLPLGKVLPQARLIEVSGAHACARTTTAVSCVIQAQARGELVAWVQPKGGALFPPDFAAAGVDLESFIVIHVPRHAGPFALVRAAEWLARSGAFGLTVVDLTDALPRGSSVNWQGRLQGLLRQYDGRIVLLTSNAHEDPSLGPLVGLRVEANRSSLQANRFEVHTRILKDKIGIETALSPMTPIAPSGLRGTS